MEPGAWVARQVKHAHKQRTSIRACPAEAAQRKPTPRPACNRRHQLLIQVRQLGVRPCQVGQVLLAAGRRAGGARRSTRDQRSVSRGWDGRGLPTATALQHAPVFLACSSPQTTAACTSLSGLQLATDYCSMHQSSWPAARH